MALSSNPERTLLVLELLPIPGNPNILVVGGSILQFFLFVSTSVEIVR
jgi:hypothetical protein